MFTSEKMKGVSMKLNKNQIFGVIGLLILFGIAIRFLLPEEEMPDGFIIKETAGISIEDVKDAMKRVNFEDQENRKLFAEETVNQYTFKYFKFLQKKFGKSGNLNQHLAMVREYLFSTMDQDEAEKLFNLYKKFIDYEQNLAARLKDWGRPGSPVDALKTLNKIHQYQKDVFGDDIAVKLFGAEIKAKEYPIRKSSIVHDKTLYGKEKEEQLKELNRDMWGKEDSSLSGSNRPYDQYREKLDMYSRDLSELEDAEKTEKLSEYRREFFSDEVIERLEQNDQMLLEQKNAEALYKKKESQVQSDPNLTAEEKSDKLLELQGEIFGDDAAAFRRRENIRKGLKQ